MSIRYKLLKLKIRLLNRNEDNIEYARYIGVKMGGGCNLLDFSWRIFGSEPFLVTIGDNVRINAGVRFYTHDGACWVVRNLYNDLRDADIFKKIVVGNNVHIGSNASILPGVRIGNNCVIGLGAIVTKDVPDNSIVVGVPAIVVSTIDEYVKKFRDVFLSTKGLKGQARIDAIMEKLE